MHWFFAKFCFILLREKKTNFAISKIRKFHEKNVKNTKVLRTNYGREIINYDITKLLMLSCQSNYGFRKKVFKIRMKIFTFFRIFSRKFLFAGHYSFLARLYNKARCSYTEHNSCTPGRFASNFDWVMFFASFLNSIWVCWRE